MSACAGAGEDEGEEMGSSEVLTATIPDGSDLPVLITHFAEESILFMGQAFSLIQHSFQHPWGRCVAPFPPRVSQHNLWPTVACCNAFQPFSLSSAPFTFEPLHRKSFAKGSSSLCLLKEWGRLCEAIC